jgi:hypothetical protein
MRHVARARQVVAVRAAALLVDAARVVGVELIDDVAALTSVRVVSHDVKRKGLRSIRW